MPAPRAFGPVGGGQLDELVRVQRRSQAVRAGTPEAIYEDIVPGGSAEQIAASTKYASVVRDQRSDEEQEVRVGNGEVTFDRYIVKIRLDLAISTAHRLLWRRKILNITSVDSQTMRREGGGYTLLHCLQAGDAPLESVAGGGQVGGTTGNGNTSPAPGPGDTFA